MDERAQKGKVHNVRRVAGALDGVYLAPRAVLSWNDAVGPPSRLRGFVPGPELHDGELCMGIGGGACQVANLLYWLAVHAGLEIVERHRHALDLFPDDGRDVPFGLGATVFWPHRDLVVRNPHAVGVRLGFVVGHTALDGSLTAEAPLPASWEVHEVQHRFVKAPGGTVLRQNTLVRRERRADAVIEHPLAEHCATVCYPVPPHLLEDP